MPTVAAWPFAPENTFVEDLDGLFVPWEPAGSPEPRLLALNDDLATDLGFDPDALRSADGLAMLSGNVVPDGLTPVAQAYAGHQFGGYSPRLGDGRALLLGEVVDRQGRRRDLHMKGSGRTPFARGGDGKAAVGPMVRELIIGEAMHGLGIPTTRALAVVATGEPVARDAILPGAVLTRVAASHLRVGTFQFAAATGDLGLLERLVGHAIARHHPTAADAPNRALALLEAVTTAQASLVARWMLVGFIHGVMNTDNTTISGETIDYGPCAFMDAYDPDTVFSSIDHAGRYAYGNQPAIMAWNLARLAETLLPLIDEDADAAVGAATEVLHRYPDLLAGAHEPGMRAKLGLDPSEERPGDPELAGDLLALMQERHVDFTSAFRSLSSAARGEEQTFRQLFEARTLAADPTVAPVLQPEPVPISTGRPVDLSVLNEAREQGGSPNPAGGAGASEGSGAGERWLERWLHRIGPDRESVAAAMDAVNPIYIPRNHLVEEALDAATDGDMAPAERLLAVLADPFAERPGLERYAEPAPTDFGPYQTFCGT